jgi:uncharacterized protein YjdB
MYVPVYTSNQSTAYSLLHVDPATATITDVYPMAAQYWFPSAVIFPDNEPPVVDASFPPSITFNATHRHDTIALRSFVTDADNPDAAIIKTVIDGGNPALIQVIIRRDSLFITPLKDLEATETTTVSLKFNSNGKVITQDLTVIVDPGAIAHPVKSVALNHTTAEVAVGETLQLTAGITPTDADNKALTWTSSQPLIASVDPNGLVTVHLAPSTVVITATTLEGGFTATCVVTTTAPTPPTPVYPFELNMHYLTLTVDEAEQLSLLYPDEYTALTWRSDDEDIALVSSAGKVIARGEGTTWITAEDLLTGYADYCEVRVEPAIVLNPFELNIHSLTLDREQTAQLSLTAPEQYTVTWRSNNESVATVSSTGMVLAVGVGTTTIVAEDLAKGKQDECTVSVSEKPIEYTLRLDHTLLVMNEGDRIPIAATVSPATEEVVRWSTSHPEVADVTSGGTVIAIAGGQAEITAQGAGGTSATCRVTVRDVPVYAEVSEVDAHNATLIFPRISGAGYYLVHLYEKVNDVRTPIVSYKLNTGGEAVDTIGPLRAPASVIRLVWNDLHSATLHEADIDVVRETAGVAETVSLLHVSFQTAWGTGIGTVDRLPAAVRYADGRLHLVNLSGYACNITSVTGQHLKAFQAEGDDQSFALPLAPGVYILSAQKETKRQVFRFIVR